MLDQFLDALAQAFVTALAGILPVLAVYAIRYVKAKTEEAVSNLSPDAQWVLREAARLAVRAAEQLGLKDTAFDKYEYAFGVVQLYLAERGVDCDVDLIRAAIEAAVLKEFNSPQEIDLLEG